MQILYHSRTRKPALERKYGMAFVDLESLLQQADFVSLHAPLTPETRRMIGDEQLRMMKPTSVLINTARGPLVDPRALHLALSRGWIAAAGIDVTDPEPISSDDALLELENVVIAPHIASASVATRSRMAMLAAEQLMQALQGKVPKHVVNREVVRKWRNSQKRHRIP
jgi:phosphoglycerate dehydrogenase-like enzyme